MNTQLLQTMLAIPYVIFLPGLLITFIFFNNKKIDWVERIALSFALSLSIVPLIVFYTNLAGIRISQASVLGECVILNVALMIIVIIVNLDSYLPTQKYFYFYQKHPLPQSQLSRKNFGKHSNSKIVRYLYTISIEIFQVSLVTYLILLIAETIKPGIVTYFFNLNILLVFVVSSGIIMVLTHYEEKNRSFSQIKDWNWKTMMQYVHQKEKEEEEKHKETKIRKWDWYYIFGVSLGGGLLVNYKISDLGGISLIITFATMIIIALLSYLIFTEKE